MQHAPILNASTGQAAPGEGSEEFTLAFRKRFIENFNKGISIGRRKASKACRRREWGKPEKGYEIFGQDGSGMVW